MLIAVLGTGDVGTALATAFVAAGHEVWLGSRDAARARPWADAHGDRAHAAGLADAVAAADVVVNATNGLGSLDALRAAGLQHRPRTVVVDVANPLDFSGGFPPALTPSVTDSLAEQIQRAFPDTRVVKALNTVNNAVMVDPASVPGTHHTFLAGDDAGAKQTVAELLATLGWRAEQVVDLGGIVAARGLEAYLLLWLSLVQAGGGSLSFNIAVVRP